MTATMRTRMIHHQLPHPEEDPPPEVDDAEYAIVSPTGAPSTGWVPEAGDAEYPGTFPAEYG